MGVGAYGLVYRSSPGPRGTRSGAGTAPRSRNQPPDPDARLRAEGDAALDRGAEEPGVEGRDLGEPVREIPVGRVGVQTPARQQLR
jgi:hypothetical protein